MKKLTYLLASAALLAACQSQPTTYNITGTIEEGSPVQDNTLAVLLRYEGTNIVHLDTAEIQNKQFVFEGQADSAQLVYLRFFNQGERVPYTSGTALMLENGRTTVQCKSDKQLIIGGTANNELQNTINFKEDSIYTLLRASYVAATDSTLSQEARMAKEEEHVALEAKCFNEKEDMYRDIIRKNIGNPLGYTYFTMYGISLFTTEEQEALIAQIPSANANSSIIQHIQSGIDTEKRTAVGQKFTDFTMKNPEGKDIKLSDIIARNKVTLVDFWASWCGPCRMEMPEVVNDYKNFKDKGLGVIGVSLDKDAGKWKQAIKELGLTWEQVSDLKGWDCEGAKLYNVRAIPATLLIGQDGTILAKNLRGEDLTNKLAELLK